MKSFIFPEEDQLLRLFLLKENYSYHLLIFISSTEQQISYNLSIFLILFLISLLHFFTSCFPVTDSDDECVDSDPVA